MTTTLTAADQPVAPATGHGHEALWMLNTLMVERATARDTGGQYSVFEVWGTEAGNPPPHMHDDTDEAFLVLDGTVDVTVGEVTTTLSAGGFAFGPALARKPKRRRGRRPRRRNSSGAT